MLTCKDVGDTASDYLEGPTTFLQRFRLRAHLLLCVHCRRYFRQFELTSAVAKKITAPREPSDEEIESLLQKLKTQGL